MPDAPRWLPPEAAAAYLGLRVDHFLRRVKEGGIPAPSQHLGPRTPRWDRERLDAVMSGKAPSADHKEIVSGAVQSILSAGRSRRKAPARGRNGQGVPVPEARTEGAASSGG